MRGHLHELARYFKIHFLHTVKVFKVLIEYLGYFYISYLYFIFRQQHKDKAERTVEILKLISVLNYAVKMKSRIVHYQ